MRKVKPLISIIIPNYNHEKYLAQRLESVFNQTYTDFEVILLDDCSTDNSRAILLEYAKNPKVSHCVFNEINSGNTFVQWNKGIELAKGEYIWVAETDDFCELNFLEELIKPLIEDKDIVLSYCQSNRVDENGVVTGTWLNHTEDLDAELFLENFIMNGNTFIERYLIYWNVIPNSSGVVFRKRNAEESGPLEVHSFLKYCGDWLLYLKLLTNNKIAYNASKLNFYRYHSQSVITIAHKTGKFLSYNGVDINLRKMMSFFLKRKKPYNLRAILKLNTQITNNLKYEKAFYLFRNNQKVNGSLILISIMPTFIKKYQFRKNFILRIERITKQKE
jgi:glycosyltransferase involved in cell wall biosynthesis